MLGPSPYLTVNGQHQFTLQDKPDSGLSASPTTCCYEGSYTAALTFSLFEDVEDNSDDLACAGMEVLSISTAGIQHPTLVPIVVPRFVFTPGDCFSITVPDAKNQRWEEDLSSMYRICNSPAPRSIYACLYKANEEGLVFVGYPVRIVKRKYYGEEHAFSFHIIRIYHGCGKNWYTNYP